VVPDNVTTKFPGASDCWPERCRPHSGIFDFHELAKYAIVDFNLSARGGMSTKMVRFFAASLLLLAPASAAAQTAQQTLPPPAAMNAIAPTVVDDCLRYYPPAAVQAGEEGNTELGVHLMQDGTATNAKISSSSGHADLDSAAVSCLNGKHLKPITHKGSPLEVDTGIEVDWRISAVVHSAGPANSCRTFYPPVAGRLDHEGTAYLSFTVAGDGTVKDVFVARSTGYPELDNASAACVAGFHYAPVTQGGKPVEYDAQTDIVWQLRP